jgi:pimeloyl-ACP methyl ester carboxylesterase
MRSGQLAALGQDLIELADVMALDAFAIVGHDWGARAAYIAASQCPDRITHCVTLSVGYGTNDPNQGLSLKQVRNYWYHWYMALDRGAALIRADAGALARFMWESWSPDWRFTDAEFAATVASFDNPDWADIVLHSYRHRWGLAAGDPRYDGLEKKLNPAPPIAVPTLVIHGGGDACNDPATSEGKEAFFSGRYERVVLDRVGHFPQREAPDRVADAIARFIDT